ncbi:hypothetical protein ANN_04317 [Periplaneta americana]|uniref:DUF4817 domain-containing protein n=1 Tax=Periplaneta americana TaxID=6978 RepID=A0ABQ8T9R6_PERAM|nr:hypothetical protein ANN_04317 [Periplaneta americana]
MATVADKTRWYTELDSIVAMQRQFRQEYQRNPLNAKTIRVWKHNFLETGSVAKKHGGADKVYQMTICSALPKYFKEHQVNPFKEPLRD